MDLVAEVWNGLEAIQRFRELLPDVTLLNLRLQDMNGIDVLLALRTELHDTLRGKKGSRSRDAYSSVDSAYCPINIYERESVHRRSRCPGVLLRYLIPMMEQALTHEPKK
jgi:hypothetical protein